MIIIDDIIISDEIIEHQFLCDLNACKGACCVEGESGAPLEQDELQVLQEIYPKVKKYLTDEGRKAIEEKGFFVKDKKGIAKTPLMPNMACAYVQYEKNGTASCGIQKAFNEGKITFPKPVSCHLYPIRITKSRMGREHVNYEEWEICTAACKLGKKMKLPIYRFVKEALIRKYGPEFYAALEQAVSLREKAGRK